VRLKHEELSRITAKKGYRVAASVGGGVSCPVTKSVVRNAALGALAGEEKDTARYVVRIKSFRRRLADADNLCGKFFTDMLRYTGIIPDDNPEVCEIITTQEKVAKKCEEFTRITVERILPAPGEKTKNKP